jgi:hypothetical protein
VTVTGDLLFGRVDPLDPEGTDLQANGGTYNLKGGTLQVQGEIRELATEVDGAQLHVDGGTLDVTGDITVQTFRTGNAVGSTGSFTLTSGKTITNTGTFMTGGSGDGTFVNAGGTVNVTGNDIRLAGEGAASRGSYTQNSGSTVAVGLVQLGYRDSTDPAELRNTFTVKDGTLTANGIQIGRGAFTEADVLIQEATSTTVTVPSIIVGQGANSDATFTLDGGVVDPTDLQVAIGANSSAIVTINGGQLTATSGLDMATPTDGSAQAEFDMTNGQLNVSGGNFEIALYGVGEASFSGGVLDQTTGNMIVGQNIGANGTLNVSGTAELNLAQQLRITNKNDVTGLVNLTGGTVNVAQQLDTFNTAGTNTSGTAAINVGGTAELNVGTNIVLGNADAVIANLADNKMAITGGAVNVSNDFLVAKGGGSKAYLDIDAGQVNIGSNLTIAATGATAQVDIDGGAVNIGGEMNLSSGTSNVNINNGTVNANGIDFGDAGTHAVNIAGGTVNLTASTIRMGGAGHNLTLTSNGVLNMDGGEMIVSQTNGANFTFSGGRLENLGYYGDDVSGNDLLTTPVSGATAVTQGLVGTESPMGGSNLVAGQFGNAVAFDGDLDSVSFGVQAGDPAFTSGVFSVAMWFQLDPRDPQGESNHAVDRTLVSQGAGSGNDNFSFGIGDNPEDYGNPDVDSIVEQYMDTSGGDGNFQTPVTGGVSNGAWHQIVLTYDKNRASDATEIYLDGVFVGSHNNADGNFDAAGDNSPLALGLDRVRSNNTGSLHGMIDDFAIFTDVLTVPEITNLQTMSVADLGADNLFLYAPLDDLDVDVVAAMATLTPMAFQQTGGVFAPGASIGTSTIGGTYELYGGSLEIEIDGLAGGGEVGGHDLLVVAGDDVSFADVYLQGNLDLIVSATGLNVGDEFLIIDNLGDAIDGQFNNAFGGEITSGAYTFSVNYNGGDGNDVVLAVTQVPEPSAILLAIVGLLGLAAFRRRRR